MSSYRDLGFHIRVMSNLLKRKMFELAPPPDAEKATPVHGRIMGYLYDHRNEEIFQRDLEETFQIRRSTASRLLKSMEEQGLIRRESVARDARLKKLVLTEKALSIQQSFQRRIRKTEAILTSGLTEQEIEAFVTIAAKIEHNLS